jgi:Na+-transporting NADH:ubiquinone oxidoreductase subunit C
VSAETGDPGGWIGLRRLPEDSTLRAILVTGIVCAICSAAIAFAVSWLRPYQEANRARERAARIQQIVASVPGLDQVLGAAPGEEIEARVVELATGRYADDIDPRRFEPGAAAREAATSVVLPPARDLAGIGRRASHAVVFLVRDDERLRLLVLPVYGAGYVSTLHGYLALDADGNTIRGLSFYDHAETPGLGSRIDDPLWREQWVGKLARDASGALRLGVARSRVKPGAPTAAHEVDGISGATRTGVGVTNLLRFWLGPDGFGPYLQRLAKREPDR